MQVGSSVEFLQLIISIEEDVLFFNIKLQNEKYIYLDMIDLARNCPPLLNLTLYLYMFIYLNKLHLHSYKNNSFVLLLLFISIIDSVLLFYIFDLSTESSVCLSLNKQPVYSNC